MAEVIITLKIMPESPEVDLEALESVVKEKILGIGADFAKSEQIPVAFGLKSLNMTFVIDESKGDTEPLEQDISALSEVNSVEVIDCRRTIG